MPIESSIPSRAARAGVVGASPERPIRTWVGRDQDVTTVRKPIAQQLPHFGGKSRGRVPGELLRFRHAAGRAGSQQHGGLREYQRGILDEHRIRKLFQRRQHRHLQSGRAQGSDIGLVFGQHAFRKRAPGPGWRANRSRRFFPVFGRWPS